jgi:protein-disulfide isomerase
MEQNFEVELAKVESKPEVGEVGIDKTKLILPGAILIAALLVSGSIVFYSLNTGQLGANIKQAGNPTVGEKVNVSADDDAVLGNAKAEVTVIEFSDFQCPFCRAFWSDAYQQIKKEYIDTGKIKFVFRDYPLSFHPAAQVSAESAECADEQGKFWEMHDKIFQEQAKQGTGTVTYGTVELKKWASQIGLNSAEFNQCLDSGKYKSEVEKDVADGSAYGVSGTPTLFINGNPIVGAQPFSAFKAIIDGELK